MHCCNPTCDLISDELAALYVTNTGEEGPDLLLGHGLGQVIDDKIRL